VTAPGRWEGTDMTRAEAEALTATLHEKLVARFAPLGIEVTCVLDGWFGYSRYYTLAEYTFRSAGADKSAPGVHSELTISFEKLNEYWCRTGPSELDDVVEDWERILRDWVPNLFVSAPGARGAESAGVTSG
jgi:hypothetical protein